MSDVPRQLLGNAPMIESPGKQGHFDPRYGRFDGPGLARVYLGYRRRPWISAWLSMVSSSSSRATTTSLFQTPE